MQKCVLLQVGDALYDADLACVHWSRARTPVEGLSQVGCEVVNLRHFN